MFDCLKTFRVFLNIFIAILEESYVASKMKDKNHWIYSYLNLDALKANDEDGDNKNKEELNENKVKKESTSIKAAEEKKKEQSSPNKFVKKFIKTLSFSLNPKSVVQGKNESVTYSEEGDNKNSVNRYIDENSQEENIIEKILISQSQKVK